MRRKMMTGYSNQILQGFFKGENKITPNSQWHEKVNNAQTQLESGSAIKYMVGYPQGSSPIFYILCDSEELMEHTKDWLNCALPRYYCQFARPCKTAEYDFEGVLLQHWPHGFLKVTVWGRESLGIDQAKYRMFLPEAMKQSQEALNRLITRYLSSPVINRQTSKPIGMLVKGFIDAYENHDHASMVEHYDSIASSEDIERRNKDTLKFMLLEAEEKWEQIIEFARQRNVSAQVISSGVSVAIMHAVISLSTASDKGINSFELDWPSMYEISIEFLPIFQKQPFLDDDEHWKLWAILSYLFNIDGWLAIARLHLNDRWLDNLIQQDTTVNATSLSVEVHLDLSTKIYDEQSILFVINYSQTCYEEELINIYEWVESAPLPLKVKLKQDSLYNRLWLKLEESALILYRL